MDRPAVLLPHRRSLAALASPRPAPARPGSSALSGSFLAARGRLAAPRRSSRRLVGAGRHPGTGGVVAFLSGTSSATLSVVRTVQLPVDLPGRLPALVAVRPVDSAPFLRPHAGRTPVGSLAALPG